MYKKKVKIKVVDILALALIVFGLGFIIYKLSEGSGYNWNFSVIPQYLFRFDEETGSYVSNMLMHGFYVTIKLSIWGTLFAIVVGTLVGLFRTSSSLFLNLLGRSYVELVRNIPPLVLVFIFYYFFSDNLFAIFGFDDFIRSLPESYVKSLSFLFDKPSLLPQFLSAAITLGLYEAAYVAEIVRAGLNSIEKGQWEASASLGLSKVQQYRYIIFPQVTVRVLPPLAGQFISTIKDSAMVSVISIQDLTFQGDELVAATHLTREVWITVTLLYFVLTFTLSYFVGRLEKRYQKRLA